MRNVLFLEQLFKYVLDNTLQRISSNPSNLQIMKYIYVQLQIINSGNKSITKQNSSIIEMHSM